jgi:hypothetical protein
MVMVIRGRYTPEGVKVAKGTAQGQMMFWDATLQSWVNTETSELIWDDTNKTIGINDSTPDADSKLDVKGTVMVTRLLAGGVQP